LLLLIITNHALAELKIDSVSPNLGLLGEDLQVINVNDPGNSLVISSVDLDKPGYYK
jgi:hypothetical protein